jgi:hypothetical protein
MRLVSLWLRAARWGLSSDWSTLRSKLPQIRPDEAVDEVDELVIERFAGFVGFLMVGLKLVLWVFRDGGFVGFPMVGLRWIISGLQWWVCCDGGFVGFPMVVCGGLSVDCGGGFAVMVCCDGGFVGFSMVVCGGLSVDCGGGFAVSDFFFFFFFFSFYVAPNTVKYF